MEPIAIRYLCAETCCVVLLRNNEPEELLCYPALPRAVTSR